VNQLVQPTDRRSGAPAVEGGFRRDASGFAGGEYACDVEIEICDRRVISLQPRHCVAVFLFFLVIMIC